MDKDKIQIQIQTRTFLIILVIIFGNNVYLNFAYKNETVHEALSLIIQEALIEDGTRLLFYVNFNNKSHQERLNANDFLSGILPSLNDAPYKVFCQKQKLFFNFKHSEVIILDDLSSFKFFFRNMFAIGNMNLSRTLLFITSLKTLDYNTIYMIFKDFFFMDMIQVALVIELAESNEIVMLTYFPFTPKACRNFEPIIINRYLADQHRWQHMDYFPNKLYDFYGCPVTCCTWEEMPYFSVKRDKHNPTDIDYVGIEAELLKYLAGRLNFTIKIHWIEPIKEEVDNKLNVFGPMFAQHCDFALGGFSYRKDLDFSSSFSQTNYFMFSQIFIVTNVINFYTAYEKLAFPFHYAVWFALGLSFALSSLCIYICGLRRQWLRYRNFLIGSTNKTPHFHLYALAVGATMSTTQMPKRNFARFLITCWLMLTFILRNAYQSGMYQLLRDNKQWNPPQTIENVFEQNYLISATPKNRRYLDILPNVNRKLIFNTTVLEAFGELLNANTPIAFVTPYEYFGYFGRTNGSQWQHLHLVKERVLAQQLTIYIRHHSYLIPEFNLQISHSQYNGLAKLWIVKNRLPLVRALKLSSESSISNNINSDKHPLSMNELAAIFMILIWLNILSFGVFLGELMWFHYGCVVKKWYNKHFIDN
ncbi:uncharacterized protein ACRADG_007421 [Cochliomyia hominivorax]